MDDVTHLLTRIENGDPHAAAELLPLLYDELRRLAAHHLAGESPGQTLQATALVHEAYLRLLGNAEMRWDSRGHFFGAAAEAMRRILVERARRKAAVKHGGCARRVSFEEALPLAEERSEQLLALDEALTELERHDAQAARLVTLRYFAGLTHQESAAALGITRRQADRLWALARAWLYQQLQEP